MHLLEAWEQNAPTYDQVSAVYEQTKGVVDERIRSYIQTLPPLLRDALRFRFLHEPPDSGESGEDLMQALNQCIRMYELYWAANDNPESLHKRLAIAHEYEAKLTDAQKQLLFRHMDSWMTIGNCYGEATLTLSDIHVRYRDEIRRQLTDIFWASHGGADLQFQLGYEAAKLGFSNGTSGFHSPVFHQGDLPMPFCAIGWGSYQHPGWGDAEGVAFRIESRCFDGRSVQLYYFDDDQCFAEHRDMYVKLIETYSSGIADIRIEDRVCTQFNQTKQHSVILFRLEPKAIRETVVLSGKSVPTSETGEYIFVLPRCGEFFCQLGEIQNDEMIPLHKDDFCMK